MLTNNKQNSVQLVNDYQQSDSGLRDVESSNRSVSPLLVAKRITPRETSYSVDKSINVYPRVSSSDDITLNRTPYSTKTTDWSDVHAVTRSSSGVRGAWFYDNPSRGRIVVKKQEGATSQVMGTLFLRGMGIQAPDIKIVSVDSKEGQQLSHHGDPYGLNQRNSKEYIVMNFVKGRAFEDLGSEDKSMIDSNLAKIGEITVLDMVIGNFDRFDLQSNSFNAGNLMFDNNRQAVAIDTDCVNVHDGQFGFSKLALKKITEERGEYESKIANLLGEKYGCEPKLFNTRDIKTGMNTAIKSLKSLDLATLKNKFNTACKNAGYDRQDQELPEQLHKLITHVKETTSMNEYNRYYSK